jgi:hypothetical protein
MLNWQDGPRNKRGVGCALDREMSSQKGRQTTPTPGERLYGMGETVSQFGSAKISGQDCHKIGVDVSEMSQVI